MRILRIRASEQYAILMFRYCSDKPIVDDIDEQIRCVWFA